VGEARAMDPGGVTPGLRRRRSGSCHTGSSEGGIDEESPLDDPGRPRADTPGLAFLVALLAIVLVPAVIFPGDAPFINDDAWLLLNALQANEAGRLAVLGLKGTKGLAYGPVPTWLYQGLLLATRDPVKLVVAHAVLLGGALAVAIHGLARVTGLWKWFGLVLAASPYLWFYNRLLWDNTLNLAFTAFAFLLYLVFLSRGSRLALAGSMTLGGLSLLTHMMGLAMTVAILGHLVIVRRRDVLRLAWILLLVGAVLLGAAGSYWRVVWDSRNSLPAYAWNPSLRGALFALTGPRLLGATGLDYFYGARAGTGFPLAVAWLSAVLYPLTWAGMAVAARRAWQGIEGRSAGTIDSTGTVALGAVLVQVTLDALVDATGHPHYHNATWIAHAVLAWIAVSAFARWRPAARVVAAAVAAGLVTGMVGVDAWLLADLHRTGGTRDIHYGATMAEQLRLVDELRRFSEGAEVIAEVKQFQLFPHPLGVLGKLVPRTAPPSVAARALIIRHASPDPEDAHLELVAR
jgi:hypothetical protein